jgi:hypothetical protein
MPVQCRRRALAGVVSAGEGKLGFTGHAGGRGRALQQCRTGVGSGSRRQQRQGWPATGRGRAAAAHRQRAGGVAGAVGGACVRVREESERESWAVGWGLTPGRRGRLGRPYGPVWAGLFGPLPK